MRTESLTNSGTFVVTSLKDSLAGTGLKGVISIDRGNTDVTLQGSVDNSHFVNIETFTGDTIKEITEYFPLFKKDMLYNIRNRNCNKWGKNMEVYSRITLEKF